LSVAIPQVTVTLVVPPAVVGTATTVLPFGPPGHPRGKVSPIVTVEGVPTYTVRLSAKEPGLNSKWPESRSSAAIRVTDVPIANMDATATAGAPEIRIFFTWMALLGGRNDPTPGEPLTYTAVKAR
jgi:hypothetical protein